MSQCEICETEITDGEKYCSECSQGVDLNEHDESEEESW